MRPETPFGPGASPDAELFCEPSLEVRRLLRAAPDFVNAKVVRALLIVPLCQLTFLTFDLQIFAIQVLHTTAVSKAVHLVGITLAHLFLFVLVGQWLPALVIALIGWQLLVARRAGLPAWGIGMVAVMATLAIAARALGPWMDPTTAAWALLASAFTVAVSHLTEPTIPPRAAHPMRWVSMRVHVFGTPEEPVPWPVTARRMGQMLFNFPMGLLNETVAFPRVYPYFVLLLMMRLGYAPDLRALLRDRVTRAQASGNPAIDYVGIGGGTPLSTQWGDVG